jgi:hypothetical protein
VARGLCVFAQLQDIFRFASSDGGGRGATAPCDALCASVMRDKKSPEAREAQGGAAIIC